MKKFFLSSIIMAVVGMNFVHAKSLDEYLKEAETFQSENQIEKAISTMEQAVKEYPDSSAAYAYLGIAVSMKAQKMKDYEEIFNVIKRAFEMWNKALSLDPLNITARFYRGAWAVNIPKFVGQLETGIKDMEIIVAALKQSPDQEARAQLVEAYQQLATGYQKAGDYEKAKEIWNEIIIIAPGTEFADAAQRAVENIVTVEKWFAEKYGKKRDVPEITELKQKLAEDPNNIKILMALSKAFVDNNMPNEAYRLLKQVISLDPSNLAAYKLLAAAMDEIAAEEYDPRIYLDTDFRTDQAFEAMAIIDKIVELSPDDLEMRFIRGITAIQMPFFVGKFDQGIDDLNLVAESDVPDKTKAEALYWLGVAYQKKAMTQWINVVSDYPNTEAVKAVFDHLNPGVKRLNPSQYKKPAVVIDFVLGFKDELAPQTAVWVEDKEGNFVKTIYVSGFSRFAKEKQINLPIWARSSEFVDVDAITGASIDLGHHIYVWDVKNHLGKKVKSGEYVVKVEVSYWPSMQYQRVEAPIKIGRKDKRTVVEEGNLIPYLEVKYSR